MEQKLQMVEFGVAGLAEVRTLLKRWKKVVAELAQEDEAPYPSLIFKSYHRLLPLRR